MAWKNFAGFSGTVKYTQWKSHNKKCSVSLLERERERERERGRERERQRERKRERERGEEREK